MKFVNLVLIIVFFSSMVFAETTIEIIQQRAETGDATAQAFLGMAYQYGCAVSPDPVASQKWFSKAADQGNEFAAKRCFPLYRTASTPDRISTDIRSMPPEVLQNKIKQASSAPYEGDVTFDELAINRNKYVGKVIELSFTILPAVGMPSDGNQYIFVRDPRSSSGQQQGSSSDRLYLCGEDALKWRQEVGRKAYGIASTVCALVEKDGLIAVGSRKRKTGDGYTYSW